MKNKILFTLVGILLVGFCLRTINLVTNPPGFFADEASIGYDAYKILTTGRDMHEKVFPFFFESLGEYKHPISIYATVPSIALFGLNEFSVRMVSVFFGIATIIFLYLLVKELFSWKIALVSSGFASITPWLIHYNRIGFELNSYIALFILSLFLFTKSLKDKKCIIPMFISFSLLIYTYYPAKLIAPLMLLSLLVLVRKYFLRNIRLTIIGLILFVIISTPFLISLHDGSAFERLAEISLYSSEKPFAESLNQGLYNYLLQLSPSIFIQEEKTFITRHFIQGLRPLLLSMIPLALVGIGTSLHHIKKWEHKLLLVWLLLYPMSGFFVLDGPFTSRNIIGAPLFCIYAALGTVTLLGIYHTRVYKYTVSALLFTATTASLVIFIRFYFGTYPNLSANYWGWQFGSREILSYFVNNQKDYDELYLAPEFNAPDILIKFYTKELCPKCHVGRPDSYDPHKKQLFAFPPEYIEQFSITHLDIKRTIFLPNSSLAFYIARIGN